MRVYRFLCSKYGLKTIKERRLRISRVMALNDPFEFLSADLSDSLYRTALNRTKRDLSSSKGVLCFSKTWSNPLLWSHYAEKHQGIYLGFDLPLEHLSKVKYQKTRNKIGNLDEEFMSKILTTKFSHWRYENEYRCFIQLDDDEADSTGNYFLNFSDQLQLKEVIVGANCKLTRQSVVKTIEKMQGVKIFKARPAFKTFNVVRNRNAELWK
jgi:hypothetical protein